MNNSKLNGMRRRLYTGLAVLGVLVMISAFYYYYISKKEQKIQDRNFRILHRIEKNLERRIGDYRQLLISNLKVCDSCLDEKKHISLENLRQRLRVEKIAHIEADTNLQSPDWDIVWNGTSSIIYFHFYSRDIRPDPGESIRFRVGFDIEDILAGVLRYDVFPSYMLTSAQGIAYNNCREVSAVIASDSLMKNDNVTNLKIGSGNFLVFSHPFSLGREQGLTLSGIVSAEQYGHDKFRVPGSFLLGVILLLLVILLAFPFIKSFLVSAEETLNLSDILLALLSLFLLCYMYVFLHMNAFTVPVDEERQRNMLANTSDSISHAFLGELGRMRRQLSFYDSTYARSLEEGGTIVADSSGKLDTSYYSNFSRAFWLNRQGVQVTELYRQKAPLFETHNTERDYHDRGYFLAARNNALWYPDSSDADRFYLEPVYSRIDGSFRAVMSMKSITPSLIAVMSSEMKSVINTILPREVDFCVLDTKGDILFTSTGNQHINENLLEECNWSREVSSALYARASSFFEHPFMGKDCSFYIRPIPGLPLHLVTLSYNEYSGNTQLQVCIYTSLFIVAILILFSLVILFLILLTQKNRNKLVRQPSLDLSLLYPASNYLFRDFGGIVFNFVLLAGVLVAGYFSRNEPLTLIFLLLINASGTTAAFCNARLDLSPARRTVFWIVAILFLLVCDIILLNAGGWENPLAFISLLAYELLLLWVVWQLRKVRFFEQDFDIFVSQNPGSRYSSIQDRVKSGEGNRLQRGIVHLQERFKRFMKEKANHRVKFYNQFAFMLVTWFMLIALVPTVFVYRYMYRNELENRIKSAQIDIARKWYADGAYQADVDAALINASGKHRAQDYLAGYFNTRLVQEDSCNARESKQEILMDGLLNKLRFSMKRREQLSNAVYAGNSDSTIWFCKENGTLRLYYRNLLSHSASGAGNNITVESKLPGFPMPSFAFGAPLPLALYLIAPLFFLALLFSVINFFLKRFFLFDIFLPNKLGDNEYFNQLIYKKYQTWSFKMIILGVTASGKRDLIKQFVGFIYDKKHPENGDDWERQAFIRDHLYTYDLAEIDRTLGALQKKTFKKGDIIVLNHFEHNLAEKETNDKKFLVISAIFRACEQVGSHLIILSNIHPSVFLNNQKAKTEIESFKAEDYINKQDYYNWTGLLSGFEIHVKPYPKSGTQDEPATREGSIRLYMETKSRYIFYLSIWNSLDRIEKFVLYDLAVDNLVNYRNKSSLFSLYMKGLVVLNDMPEIMNEEFKTFILTEIIEEDVELEKRQSGSRSAWNTFRIPFLMILIAVLMFVFFTQQETFNRVMAALVAIAGSLPILLKLLPFTQEKKPSS